MFLNTQYNKTFITMQQRSDLSKIIEKFFAYADNKDIRVNKQRNLIVNPEMIRVLIQQMQSSPIEQKLTIWNEISRIFASNSLNYGILLKRDNQLLEFNHSIHGQIIGFILSIKANISENPAIIQCFEPLVTGYPITCRCLKNIIQKISINFHSQRFDCQKLQLCIRLLSILFKNQTEKKEEPNAYFVMYGPNSGLRLSSERVKWSLNKGFHFYFGFYIEEGVHDEMNPLSLLVDNDSFQVLIDQGNFLRVKVFGASKMFKVKKLDSKKWYFLRISYSMKTGIIRNTYQAIITIEEQPYQLRDLPIPTLSMKDNIDQLVIGHNFYGKISVATISRQQLHSWPKRSFNTQVELQNFLTINKNKLKQIFLLYTPLICPQLNNNHIAYDITNKNHGELLQNTSTFQNPFGSVDINYYGGLYTLMPFFYILRFYKYEQYPTALEQLLQMIIDLFALKYRNIEKEALNCKFFGIITEFMNQLDERYFTMKVIELIKVWRQVIQDKVLLRKYFLQFLMKLSIDRINDENLVAKWLKIIANVYYRDFMWAIQLFSITDMLWYIIDNFQPEDSGECCLLHYAEQRDDEQINDKILHIKDQYKRKGGEVKQILCFIIKQIVSSRKFQLLSKEYDIIQFLLHNYSVCFNSLLIECLYVGVCLQPKYFIKQTQLLQTIYALFPKAEIRDQMIPVLRLLSCFIQQNAKTAKILNEQIIAHIGQHLDKIYMKNYAKIRLRSRSDGFVDYLDRRSKRKLSVHYQDQIGESSLNVKNREADRKIKNRIIQLRKMRKNKISNDKAMYETIKNICCCQNQQTGDIVLKSDEIVKIIAPYYKICSSNLKIKLIQIVKMTVFLKSSQENLPPKMDGLSKLDLIYRFILSEFILKELDPQDPEYKPSQNSNYVMKNLYSIIDNMISLMKNDWDSLYLYQMRLIQILKQARKDIRIKTERSSQEIHTATKFSGRKLILRILNWAQMNIGHMSNMVFLIYLVVFNNEKKQHYSIFDYFKSLQSNFFIDRIQIVNQFQHRQINRPIFIDQRIILSAITGFKLESLNLNQNRKYLLNQIKAYLELEEEGNEFQKRIYKLRDTFMATGSFKEMGSEGNKGFKGIFINLKNDENKDSIGGYKLYVAEIMTLLLCLCVQSSINEERCNVLKQTLFQLDLFIKAFMLSISRDNLKKDKHNLRITKLPRNLVFHLIHFLYTFLDQDIDKQFLQQIQKAIYSIINYATLIMTVLCEKIGNPQTLEDVTMLASVMNDVQLYNFFTFEIFNSEVITIGQIKQFSTLEQNKALEVIYHPHLRQYFKDVPKVFLEKHIKEVVEIHKLNLQKVQKQLVTKFSKRVNTSAIVIDPAKFYDPQQFKELQLNHARTLNLQYRQIMRIWRKIWKRLRLYHYYWSIGMDQKDKFDSQWVKQNKQFFKHKFSKYKHLQSLRPIMEVEPNQPWHIRKAQLDQQADYRSKNFMVNLHKQKFKEKLQPSFIDKFIFRKSYGGIDFQVFWIKHNSKRKGKLTVTKQKLIFEYESTYQKDSHVDFIPFLLAEYKPMKKQWPLVLITNIIRRRYLIKFQCLLFEFQDDTCLIFNFLNEDTELFLARIEEMKDEKQDKMNLIKLNNVRFYIKNFKVKNYQQEIEQICNEWMQGKITNLHYLMLLNKYSGRSFLDPVNYPVVPWVIANYECKQFVLRDLSKTLGSLGTESRKQFYESKYQSIDPFSNVPPYQYGTHYSSPGVVFNFLVRVSPYTESAKTLQGGRFDLSDRLFSSIKVCWNSVTSEVSDVRQLIPQFYYFPEFLLNIENHDFGLTQMKQRIHNVKLPIWGQNPWEFVASHRRVFESEEVTLNIHNWIDLIFGYKQKGKIAKQNLNLYYYLTYQNSVDLQTIQDEVQRTSIEAQIIHFGQTPTQIFNRPHPQTQKYSKYPLSYEKRVTDCHKIKFLGIIESAITPILLGCDIPSMANFINNNNISNNLNFRNSYQTESLIFFKDSRLIWVAEKDKLQEKQQINLQRNASKQNMYHVEDLSPMKKIQIFKGNKFIVIGSYVNGDLVVYTNNGVKLEHMKGFVKQVVYVNKAENLILCGSKNGLLQVYEIIYLEKDNIRLIKIISEYFMYPIEHISEGAGFFSFSSGNLVIISKIFRSLAYVHQKIKMQGQKMIRSIQSRRKVYGSFICTNPLYCVVFFNLLEVYLYSINGQFLKMRQIQNLVHPIIIMDDKHRENLLVLQPNGLSLLKLPQLQTIVNVAVPKKQYSYMTLVNSKVYLVSSNNEIFCVFNQKQMIWH